MIDGCSLKYEKRASLGVRPFFIRLGTAFEPVTPLRNALRYAFFFCLVIPIEVLFQIKSFIFSRKLD